MNRADVLAVLDYDHNTGVFTRRTRGGRRRAGDVAGYVKADGYRLISISGQWQYAHRLAWLVMTGEMPAAEIDHINGKRDDNRIANLRACTRSQNMMNTRKKGWHKTSSGTWQALIRVNRKRLYLGTFKTEAEAQSAYQAAAAKHHGQFAPPAKPVQEAML